MFYTECLPSPGRLHMCICVLPPGCWYCRLSPLSLLFSIMVWCLFAVEKGLKYQDHRSIKKRCKMPLYFMILRSNVSNEMYLNQHIEAKTKFCRRHFQIIFYYENCCVFITFSLKLCSSYSDNGLVPNKRQAIIWIDDAPIYWRIHASLGLGEIKPVNLKV